MANVIKVPKPGRAAFDPHRPIVRNQLIQAQVRHFHEADLSLAPEFQTGFDIAAIHTEGQAGHYIRLVTRAIHKSGGRQARRTEKAG